jgi:hypothetical protein
VGVVHRGGWPGSYWGCPPGPPHDGVVGGVRGADPGRARRAFTQVVDNVWVRILVTAAVLVILAVAFP